MVTRAGASALLFGAAALAATRGLGRAQTAATLRVALLPIDAAAQCWYAKDLGFFEKARLDVDIQAMGTGPAIVAALVSGSIDIGYESVDAVAAIHQKGVPLVLIAPASEYVSAETLHTSALVVPKNSPIQTAKDLTGKTVAVIALNGLLHTAVLAWIDQNGGDSAAVNFIEVPPPAMPAALAANRVAAAFTASPFVAATEKDGRVLVYGFDYIAKRFLASGWFSSPQWVKDHPDLVKRFVAVVRESGTWANDHQALSAQILAKYTKTDPAVLTTATRSHYGDQLTPALLQPLIDVSAKYNHFHTFPAQELIYSPR